MNRVLNVTGRAVAETPDPRFGVAGRKIRECQGMISQGRIDSIGEIGMTTWAGSDKYRICVGVITGAVDSLDGQCRNIHPG